MDNRVKERLSRDGIASLNRIQYIRCTNGLASNIPGGDQPEGRVCLHLKRPAIGRWKDGPSKHDGPPSVCVPGRHRRYRTPACSCVAPAARRATRNIQAAEWCPWVLSRGYFQIEQASGSMPSGSSGSENGSHQRAWRNRRRTSAGMKRREEGAEVNRAAESVDAL
jgi:hypothetical protein